MFKNKKLEKEFPRVRQEFWDRNNMRTISCRVDKRSAEMFTTMCMLQGTNMHRFFRSCVAYFIIREYGRERVPQGMKYADAHFENMLSYANTRNCSNL